MVQMTVHTKRQNKHFTYKAQDLYKCAVKKLPTLRHAHVFAHQGLLTTAFMNLIRLVMASSVCIIKWGLHKTLCTWYTFGEY